METHMERNFSIHLDNISKDPKCVIAAEKPDLSTKFSSLKEFSLKRHGAKFDFALY